MISIHERWSQFCSVENAPSNPLISYLDSGISPQKGSIEQTSPRASQATNCVPTHQTSYRNQSTGPPRPKIHTSPLITKTFDPSEKHPTSTTVTDATVLSNNPTRVHASILFQIRYRAASGNLGPAKQALAFAQPPVHQLREAP